MIELITQVAGMTREVAIAYIIVYGILEMLKIVVVGFVSWKGLQALGLFFKGLFTF